MGSICSISENDSQKEITIEQPQLNGENQSQQKIEILENPTEQLKNVPLISEQQNSIQNSQVVFQERQLSKKAFQIDFQKILISFLNSNITSQSLIRQLNYSENEVEQEANIKALEFVIYVAVLDFCFNQIKLPSIRNCLNICIIETYTNVLECNIQVWKDFIKRYLDSIILIYENLLEHINKYSKTVLNIKESQDKQALDTNWVQLKQNNLDISVQLAIEILEYLNDQDPFAFIKEGKANQIRLSCKTNFY